jgi:hypoxanthine phosphoribosyltransferase
MRKRASHTAAASPPGKAQEQDAYRDLAKRPKKFLSYDAIAQWIEAHGPALRSCEFTAVIGVLRGGVFPAKCVSYATGAPLYFVTYDRPTGRASWVGEPPPAGRVVLCEDVAGVGLTLQNCLTLVRRTHPQCHVLTIVSDEFSRVQPDWAVQENNCYVIFPWERHVQNPAFQKDWLEGGSLGLAPLRTDHEYRYFGVDLDGVLCADLAPTWYDSDLPSCLAHRDTLDRLASAPKLAAETFAIITGRPLSDAQRTRAWLDARGYTDVQVFHRDPAEQDAANTFKHKALTAERLGCSDFLESCPGQALQIAQGWPHLRVYWWNSGKPMLVSAASTNSMGV